jgi:Rieske 2Fe-2S family protein
MSSSTPVALTAPESNSVSISPALTRAAQQYRSGFTLPKYLYTSEEAFRIDTEFVAEHLWICVGHESEISARGCWFVVKIANESIVLVRDHKNTIRAFYNVCPHRGSRICLEANGKASAFVCPYHAWTFNLDGSLRGARDLPADFDKADNGLVPCHARAFEGLIFVNLARSAPPDFASFTTRLRPFLEPYALRDAKLATRQNFSVRSNWKLVPENTFECYHCPSGHPAYAKIHDLRAQSAVGTSGQGIHLKQESWETRARLAGFLPEAFEDSSDSPTFQAAMRFEVGFGNLTGSSDGQPVAPLLTKTIGFDGGWTYISANPLTSLLCYSDFVLTLSFIPQGPQQTDYVASWYIAADAVAGRDYEVDRLTALQATAIAEDQALINQNQEGILSRAYRPGRFTAPESRSAQLLDWYMHHVIVPHLHKPSSVAAGVGQG